MPRRSFRAPAPCLSFLPAKLPPAVLTALLLLLSAAVPAPGNPQATPSAGPVSAAAPQPVPPRIAPALRIRLGPEGNACGITPASRPDGKSAGGGPRRKPGLIVWLHGGMRSRNREKGWEAHRALLPFIDPAAYHLCSPSAFGGQEWPTPKGMAHIDALIGYMTAHYPVDPADINVVGVSDGNLGVIAYSLQGGHAFRRRVLISSAPQWVLPLEALPGQARFARGSWDFLQGGRDRLFPADQVIPYLREWERLYPNAHLHFFPEGEHDFSYYAENAPDLLKSLFSAEKAESPPTPPPRKAQGIQNSSGGN
ncbi:MAG TPA: hypothetical protein VJ385_15145 [Fibrobacteria bacterium]|nr:hypothetical protein [Fibrobacteria bacterium]